MLMRPDAHLRAVTLDDKYALESGRVYLSGVQALVRLLLEQRRRDHKRGLNTAGFVSGYRGSPLGGVDLELWRAASVLAGEHIHFEPGLNEELAATMVQGSQQIGVIGKAQYDGVFGLWYGKNPGLDRAADALKHNNAAGTAHLGGALAVSGDDPAASSSSIPNQSDHAFMSASMPTLAPADIAETITYGLMGYGLSRYAGVWVGLKTVADVIEGSASVVVSPEHPAIVLPEGLELPSDAMGMRWPDTRWAQDARLLNVRIPAALAFARANRLDQVCFGATRKPRLGVVTSGKATGDVRQALAELDIDQPMAEALGLAVYKVAMTWPLEPVALRVFAQGLEEVLVVEERRAFIEPQLKEQAYHWPADQRPRIVGKSDETGAPLLPQDGVLTPLLVAQILGHRLAVFGLPEHVRLRLAAIDAQLAAPSKNIATLERSPHFCSGCPHARSTQVPEGSLAMAGIGCHSLRLGMPDSRTLFMVQMGGEGSNWLGAAPFVATEHVFQNLGDGTYGHSGSLAIRAAVAAKRSITFRILYNGIVAMTGGQPAEGGLTIGQISHQLLAEGVKRVIIVAEDPQATTRGTGLASGVEVRPRDDLDLVQRELRAIPGVTALIYDQLCAIEKRRQRKRGALPAISSRVFINERVCEGCGDCTAQSQCAAIMPVATPLGSKRRIDQSACNADLSCLLGFCPSFVVVEGGQARKPAIAELADSELPLPAVPSIQDARNIIVSGIGGTGVVTVGAILGMAAHLQGYGCSVLDNTGIARKGGAVSIHVRFAQQPEDLACARIVDGAATLLLAADLVVAAEPATRAKIRHGNTHILLNTNAVPTLAQRLDPDGTFDAAPLLRALEQAAGDAAVSRIDASDIALRLMGDTIYCNMLMLGHAWQLGHIPLSLAALQRAIEINGNAVDANLRAFLVGRMCACRPDALAPSSHSGEEPQQGMTLDQLVTRRSAMLTDYQDAAYASRYSEFMRRVRAAQERSGVAGDALLRGVAESHFRLLAIKDEYEVARLYCDGTFRREIEQHFEGPYRLRYHLAPPLFARRNPHTGKPEKRSYGAWMGRLFGVLAKLRPLRGTPFDPFGYSRERREDRRQLLDYERDLGRIVDALTPQNQALALEFAQLPMRVRGYGHVKEHKRAEARKRGAEILGQMFPANR